MERKLDARIVKTRKQIAESFIELVELKGYNNVKVSDITKRAGLNRNTFYLHYQDKEELVKKIIQYEADRINERMKLSKNLYNISSFQITETHIRWIFRTLAIILKPNMEFYRIALLDNSLNGYMESLSRVLKKNIADLLGISNPRSSIVFEFAYNGLYGVLKQWIIYSPASDQETSKVLAKLAYATVKEYIEDIR